MAVYTDVVSIPLPKAVDLADNIPAILVLFTDRDTAEAARRMIKAALPLYERHK